MELKSATSYVEQLKLLKSRGLSITDESLALIVLENVNYYVFSGYLHEFKTSDSKYIDGLSFERVYQLYKFDCRLKNILLSGVEVVEHSLRAKIAHYLAMAYSDDPCKYIDPAIYRSAEKHKSLMGYFQKAVMDNAHVPFVKHHIDNYGGKFPIWVAVELFTLGNIEHLYKNLKVDDQDNIAKEFNTIRSVLESWISNLRQTRNLLAHQMRAYSMALRFSPKICKNNHAYKVIKNRIFDQIYLIKILYYDRVGWARIVSDLKNLITEYSSYINPAAIGFPDNWEEVLLQ